MKRHSQPADKTMPPAATDGIEDGDLHVRKNCNLGPDPRIPHQEREGNPWRDLVRIVRVTPARMQGNVRAYVDVRIHLTPNQPMLTLLGCKVVQQPGQRAWVAMPDRQVSGRWYQAARLDDEQLKQAIWENVLDAWSRSNNEPAGTDLNGDGHGFTS